MTEPIDRFPLFPLGMVLLPTEVVPLHIFEDRYKLLIGECLAADTEFGIVWLAEDGLEDTGCAARVTEVIEEMDDGRMNILVEGDAALHLVRRIDDMDYPAGDVELLDDDPEAGEELSAAARSAYADLVERVTDERPEESGARGTRRLRDGRDVDFDLDAKQTLLEIRSEDDRMGTVADLFTEAIERVDHVENAADRAKSNGKVKLP